MAISHVAAIGSNSSKTTGTTLDVTATPGTQPAVGDLIIVACARDDIANDPLTGDSCADGYGNTYQRLTFAGFTGTDSTAEGSNNAALFYSVLTAAWSGTTTVTWTHPSVTARAMRVEHFAPTSGYTIFLYEQLSVNKSIGSPAAATGTAAVPVGGLVFGYVAGARDASTEVLTEDSDTVSGSWSTMGALTGTTGGAGDSNIYVGSQYKLTDTTPRIQSYSPTGGSGNTITVYTAFFEYLPPGVVFIGAGGQAAGNGTSVTPTVPPIAAANDLLLMVIAGRPSSNAADGVTIAGGTDGWAQRGSTSFVEVGAVDLSVQLWWKIHDGSEAAPTVAVNTVLGDALIADRGYSAQILAFRRVDTTTPFDVTSVNSSSAAAATWAPTGIATATENAMALSIVATADDNALDFNTSQSFVMAFGGVDYDTTLGSDHAVGAAYKTIPAAGSVTQPTWNQSNAANDAWVGIATALRSPDASAFSTAAAAAAAASVAAATISRPAAAAAATGTGRNAVGTVRTSPTAAAAAAVGLDATVTAGQPGVSVDAGTAAAAGSGQTARVATRTATLSATATASAFNASVGATATAGVGVGVGVALQPVAGSSGSVTPTTGTAAGSALNAAASTAVTAAAQTATAVGAGLNLTGTATATPGVAAGVGAALPAAARANVNVAAQTATAAGAASNATVSGAVHAQAAAAAAGAAANPATISAMKPTVGLAVGAGLDAAVRLDVAAELAAAAAAAADLAVSVGAVATVAAATGVALDPAEVVTSSVTSPLDTIFSVLVDPGRTWVVLEVGP